MNVRIEDSGNFDEMLRTDEIKKSWTQIELYGIDAVINAIFEEELNCDDIGVGICFNKGVIEAYLHEVLEYNGIYVNRAYIHVNNEVVLMHDYGTKLLIIENRNIEVLDNDN